MIVKFLKSLLGMDFETKRKRYLNTLDDISNIVSPVLRFETLVYFIKQLDKKPFAVINVRDLIGVDSKLRHPNLMYLLNLLDTCNEHIAHNNDEAILRICKEELVKQESIDLSNYFVDSFNNTVSVADALEQIYEKLNTQLEYLSNQETQFYQRVLDKLYYDIIQLLGSLIKLV